MRPINNQRAVTVSTPPKHLLHRLRHPDFPFAPRRWPFFYGWVMLVGSVFAVMASIPGQTMGVGVFTDYLIATWGLSRGQLSAAYMFGTLISSFVLPYAGVMLDRYGSRVMAVLASLGLGAALIVLAGADLIVPVPESLLGVVIATTVVTGVFLSLRFFGQGCLAMVSRVVIGKWFERYRGRATAIAGTFGAFGFNSSPVLLKNLIDGVGWRQAALVLAALVGGGMAVFAWIFYRDNPEECGLEPDGDRAPAAGEAPRPSKFRVAHEFTRSEAARTLAFWIFAFALSSHGLMMTGLTFHIMAVGREMGLSADEAVAIFWPMTFFSVTANLAGGWLGDRIKLKYLLLIMMTAQFFGTIGLAYASEPLGRAFLTAGFGITGGLFVNLVTIVWPRYFGRAHLGAISGLNMSVMVFTSALGPTFFSGGQYLLGSYHAVILLWIIVPVMIFTLGLWIRNPQERYAE
jgi:MFS family permease